MTRFPPATARARRAGHQRLASGVMARPGEQRRAFGGVRGVRDSAEASTGLAAARARPVGSRRRRARWGALAPLLAVLAGCGTGHPAALPSPRPGVVRAADGTPLAGLAGLDGLPAQLARIDRAALEHGDLRTAIRPELQRTLIRALGRTAGAGVVVDVRSGRLLAAAGSGGRSPWRSLQAPGSTLKAILAAGALSAGTVTTSTRLDGDAGIGGVTNAGGERLGPVTLEEALVRSSNTAFADLVVRMGPSPVDTLLRSVGFDGSARAADLRGLVAPSRGAQLEQPGIHGVGPVPQLLDGAGRYRAPEALARATTFELGQVALTLASAGRRTAIGVTHAGPPTAVRTVTTRAGRTVWPMLAAVVRRGTGTPARSARVAIAAKTGTEPAPGGGTAVSMVGFAPATDPQVAVALTARDPRGRDGGVVLGPELRAVLEAATQPR